MLLSDYVLFISLSITFLFSYSLLIIRLLIFSLVNCLPIFIFLFRKLPDS